MKLLLVGGGAREHALAWKLRRDRPDLELIAAPGNPGIASLGARTFPVAADQVEGLTALAAGERVDLVVVGPEAPLSAGLVDSLRDQGISAFGPTAAAARIESSKAYAKELMRRAGVPTATAVVCSDLVAARRAIGGFGAPVVIKASGLAAGKGVMVCGSTAEADEAAVGMLQRGDMGDAGREIVVEEYMQGEELSLFVLTDGKRMLPMLPAQDHKRLRDGDEGPNTGGMGSYAPVGIASPALVNTVLDRIVAPTLEALRDDGATFTGLLYAGLMLTDAGPRVVEFNCRFGDPETEAILPLLESSLLDPVAAIATGGELEPHAPLRWRQGAAVTTVVAAGGYPGSYRKGIPVTSVPEATDDLQVFHAGTAVDAAGRLVTAGGRVAAITAVAPTLEAARRASLDGARGFRFEGALFRTDIGWRESARRRARAS